VVNFILLIQRGGGTGPEKPRQPQGYVGANSGRNRNRGILEDEVK